MLLKINKFVSIVAVVCILCTTVTVYASSSETANDLFEVYNEALIDDYSFVKDEYDLTLEILEQAEESVLLSEVHNKLLEDAAEWQIQERERILGEVQNLTVSNDKLSKQISEELSGDWDNILRLDKEYKRNLKRINQLLKSLDRFTITDKRITDYTEVDRLTEELLELKKVYNEAVDVKVLGDVRNVKYPLGAETLVTSEYGSRIDPITGSSISFHGGIDFRAKIGTEVLSLFNGVIADTGFTYAGGYYVRVDHGNGIVSYYCHLDEIKCEKGQKVSQYDVIALSGNTGSRTTGPHLHLALYINGNSVDPGILFKR
ncbi:MAG: peptidoglycan DD-metalloendopeptidase family protein [Alphaproteobacteria bacterium]|nr:peptidoglycan DD-metalloendopeptidase family protein [Alphaproteobacteria bacterium]